ncbi:MAG TPA: hypothetical protein VGV18_11230, partial [Verrucomicrobiae bacterium]|nr:hypothetical protein [Verrucomicrobiae bacterium]
MKITSKNHIRAIAATVCAGAVSLVVAQSVSGQNLLADPGFEGQVTAPNPNPTGVPGWANFGGATFSMTYAHSGSWSLYTP